MISKIKQIQIRQKLTFFPYLSLTLLILQRTSEHFREGIHTRSWRVRLSGYQALVPALFLPVVLRGALRSRCLLWRGRLACTLGCQCPRHPFMHSALLTGQFPFGKAWTPYPCWVVGLLPKQSFAEPGRGLTDRFPLFPLADRKLIIKSEGQW